MDIFVIDTSDLGDRSYLASSGGVAVVVDPQRDVDRVWVHCGSGYRSSIAASMLDAAGRQVVPVDDDFDNARRLGLAP